MSVISKFNRLVPDLSATLLRFPVPVFISLAMFAFVFGNIEDLWGTSRHLNERIYLGGFVAFLIAGGLHLLAQSKGWSRTIGLILATVGGLAAMVLLVWLNNILRLGELFIIPAAILWVMVAGFMNRRAVTSPFWLFNARFMLAILLATLVGLVFSGGMAAILASLDYLFNVRIDKDLYSHIGAAAVTIIGPIYGLSLIPNSFDEQFDLADSEDLLQRGISVLINYILVPLLVVYVIILHAYAVKIGFSFKLPKGQVGIMVLIFGLGGTATWLIARPWVDSGTWLLKAFTRWWFWFTIIPVLLLVMAVNERIGTYGVTPERYGLALVALWLVIMIGYFALRRLEARPQVILGSLALLLLLASFGPWGARGVSISSQMARLDEIMTKWKLVENGKIVAEPLDSKDIPAHVRSSGSSIVRFLRKQKALYVLKPYFAGRADTPFAAKKASKYTIARQINKQLGFRYFNSSKDGSTRITYRGNKSVTEQVVSGSLLHGPLQLYKRSAPKNGAVHDKVYVTIKDGNLLVIYNGRKWVAKGKTILTQANKAKPKSKKPLRIELSEVGGGPEAVFVATYLQGKLDKKIAELTSLRGWVLLPTSP